MIRCISPSLSLALPTFNNNNNNDNNNNKDGINNNLSGRIGKVVASHTLRLHVRVQLRVLIYTMHEELRGSAHEDGGCDQSIGSTVSDAIVRSWLWLTGTRSSPFGCFSILQVVDN